MPQRCDADGLSWYALDERHSWVASCERGQLSRRLGIVLSGWSHLVSHCSLRVKLLGIQLPEKGGLEASRLHRWKRVLHVAGLDGIHEPWWLHPMRGLVHPRGRIGLHLTGEVGRKASS